MDTKLHLSRWNPTGSAEATWPAAPPSSTTPLQSSASRLSGNMTLKLNNNNKEKKLALQLVSCSSTALGLTVERDDIQQHGALPPVGGPLQLGRGEDPDCGGWVLQSGQQLVLAQRSVLPWTIVRHVPAETTHMQQRLSFSSCPPVSGDVEINWILRERIKKTLSESCFFFFITLS